MLLDVFGRFWNVSDLGFGFGNNPSRQVFLELGSFLGTFQGPEDHVFPKFQNYSKIRQTLAKHSIFAIFKITENYTKIEKMI